jgi:hypothetical protein
MPSMYGSYNPPAPATASPQKEYSAATRKAKSVKVKPTAIGFALGAGMIVTNIDEIATAPAEVDKLALGDVLVGVNSVPLADCLHDPSSPEEFTAMMNVADGEVALNFNSLAEDPNKMFKKLLVIPMLCIHTR